MADPHFQQKQQIEAMLQQERAAQEAVLARAARRQQSRNQYNAAAASTYGLADADTALWRWQQGDRWQLV
jgi:hypothetical protein